MSSVNCSLNLYEVSFFFLCLSFLTDFNLKWVVSGMRLPIASSFLVLFPKLPLSILHPGKHLPLIMRCISLKKQTGLKKKKQSESLRLLTKESRPLILMLLLARCILIHTMALMFIVWAFSLFLIWFVSAMPWLSLSCILVDKLISPVSLKYL